MSRALLALFTSALLAGVPLEASSIVLLKSNPPPGWNPALDALRGGLTGHTLMELDLGLELAQGLRALAALGSPPAVIVAIGPLAVRVARQGAPETPLVFCMVEDPAGLGLVGAPRTAGVAFASPVRNQLAAFRAVHARLGRLGVIYGPGALKDVREAQKASSVVRMALVERPIAEAREVPQALRSLLEEEAVDAIWMPSDPLLLGEETRRHILRESLSASKPVFASSAALVMEGALASSGADLQHVGERAATLVNRLAAEGSAARLEVLTARAELALNKRVAAKLKIDLSPDVLGAAAKVY